MSDEIPRIGLESLKPTDERIEALRVQFPDVFADGQVDFDALKRSLGEWVDPSPERFGLTWPGKAGCMRVIKEPSIGTLVPMIEESVEWDTTQNVLIEGENLEVLKLLQKAYYGKVKLVYIDPRLITPARSSSTRTTSRRVSLTTFGTPVKSMKKA